MENEKIHSISPVYLIFMLIPEILGIIGIVLFYQYNFPLMAFIALVSFLALFIFIFVAGRCLIFLTIMMLLASIPVALFLIDPWYMGFLNSFVAAYGAILLALLLSQLFDNKKPSHTNRTYDIEENIHN